MLSGWLSLVFANQLCGILMRELTASYSACVPSNRSLSGKSHLHGRRLCFVGKDFTICHSLCHPTPPCRNLLARLAVVVFFFLLSFFFCQNLQYPGCHGHTHNPTWSHTRHLLAWFCLRVLQKKGRKLTWYNKHNNGFQVPCLSPISAEMSSHHAYSVLLFQNHCLPVVTCHCAPVSNQVISSDEYCAYRALSNVWCWNWKAKWSVLQSITPSARAPHAVN